MRRSPLKLALVVAGLAVGAAVAVTVGYADGPAQKAPAGKAAKPDLWTQAGTEKALAKVGRRHTPSPVVIPDQEIPVRFSHKSHIAEGATCLDCHGTVTKSIRASDNNLSAEETCFDCHDVEDDTADPPAACDTCHPGYKGELPPGVERTQTHKAKVHPPTSNLPTPRLRFPHKIHLAKGASCNQCHAGVDKVDYAHRDNALPTMGTCLECHDGKKAPNECGTCHETLPDGRLRTDFPGGKLIPAGWYHADAHDDAWLKNHRNAAQQGDGYCANCHTAKYCTDCHNGVTKPLKIHPNNWIVQHPMQARRNSLDCQSCHRSQTFCVSCHESLKIGGDPEHRPTKRIQFHPTGWSSLPRGPNHHAFQAQRNIRSCTSCHTERTCLTCHATNSRGGVGYNPHPVGFVPSGRCTQLKSKNARVCTKCHAPGTPQLECR